MLKNTRARADHALFDEVHRRRQRAGLQQLGQVFGFLLLQAGGLEVLAEHAVDVGHRDHFLVDLEATHFLAVADGHGRHALGVDHRHRLVHVGAGEVEHALAADIVQRDADRRRATVRIGHRLRADHLVAGDNHALVQQHRATAITALVDLRFRRDAAGGDRVLCVAINHRTVFKGGGGADHALGFGGVLHARQLHDHAVGTLALDDRLGHAELVHAAG
ncbi:hypothetical protein G6F40_014517 [Rhizopus arrhizus]|nr:hypothetical protein G6F40_014517 [Rhizopus arrhizus]